MGRPVHKIKEKDFFAAPCLHDMF